MTRSASLLLALSFSVAVLAPIDGARAGQDALINVPGINGETEARGTTAGYDYPGAFAGRFDGVDPGGAKGGAGKVNVGDGFATNNRDNAGAVTPGSQRFADVPPSAKPPGGNLRSLSAIGSSNELGRATLGGGTRAVDPTSPTVVYVGGSRHATGNGNLQIQDLTSVAIDPSKPNAPAYPGGVRVAVGDVAGDGGGATTGRITGVAVDPSDPNAPRHFNGVVDRFDAGGRSADAGDASGNTIYVSTAGGGAWKTKNGGGTGPAGGHDTGALRNVGGDNAPAAAGDEKGVYVLIGTPPPGAAPSAGQNSFYGTGIYKSTDGGQTWNMPASPSSNGLNGHNTGALRNVSGANTPAGGGGSRAGVGVLKSMDGGRTFSQSARSVKTK